MTQEISEYEKQRLANIERNAKYLSELGIDTSARDGKRTKSASTSSAKKRKVNPTPIVDPELYGIRRSSRLATLQPVNYTEINYVGPTERKRGETAEDDEYHLDAAEMKEDIEVGTFAGLDKLQQGKASKDVPSSSASTSNSSMSLNADIEGVLKQYLGVQFPDYGKASVMSESNHGILPKFNKYPGVLEWKNCLYLWVNVGGSGGYTNAFFEQGRHMMWYGGSKMTSESKVVQRLIEAGKPSNSDHSDSVLLFVRIEGDAYCCLGRLSYVAVDLNCSPIAMKWELTDFDALKGKDYFIDILKAAKCKF